MPQRFIQSSQPLARRWSLSTWLMGIALLCLLPAVFSMAYALYKFSEVHETQAEMQLREQAEGLALQQAAYLDKIEHVLTALSYSSAIQSHDIAGFYADAKRLQAGMDEISAISLVDSQDKVVFLTQKPWGAVVAASQLDSVHQVFATGKPNVSGAFMAPDSGLRVYTVNVPVVRDGRIVYCLRGAFRTQNLPSFVHFDALPKEWVAAILDSQLTIAARNISPEKFVGKMANTGLVKAIREKNQNIWAGRTAEGIQTLAVYRPVGKWDWYVGLGVPRSTLAAPLRQEITGIVLLTCALAVVLIGLALVLAYVLRRQLLRVQDAIPASTQGMPFEHPGTTHVIELDRIIEQASQLDRQHREALSLAHQKIAELSAAETLMTAFARAQDTGTTQKHLAACTQIHNQIAPALTVASTVANEIRSLDPQQSARLKTAVDAGMAAARDLSATLYPTLLTQLGLQSAVLQRARTTLGQRGITTHVALQDEQRLSEPQRLACYSVIQQCLDEVFKGVNTSTCSIVGAATAEEQYELTIADNGTVLLDHFHTLFSEVFPKMQAWAKVMGGTFTLTPLEDGLVVHVSLPIISTDTPLP